MLLELLVFAYARILILISGVDLFNPSLQAIVINFLLGIATIGNFAQKSFVQNVCTYDCSIKVSRFLHTVRISASKITVRKK